LQEFQPIFARKPQETAIWQQYETVEISVLSCHHSGPPSARRFAPGIGLSITKARHFL
jgi:hypothetical protein